MSAAAWIGLIVAGALGAVTRHLVAEWVQGGAGRRPTWPWGTFAVNVSGSLLLGVVGGLVLYHDLPAAPAVVLGTGFCGAYTTFSTFALQTVELAEQGASWSAALNALGTLLVGVAAAAAGLALAAAL
jgi:fluoride exporter